jgi:undecaprenyl-diphosphatase
VDVGEDAGTPASPSDREAGWRGEAELVARRIGVPMLVAIAALTALGTGAGFAVTELWGVDAWDLGVSRDLAAGRTPGWDALARAGAFPAHTVTVAVLWAGAMAVAAWRTRHWAVPVLLLVAIGGEKLTYLVTSWIVGRPRPPVESLGHVFATSSFPSGHVASAITLYGGLVLAVAWSTGRRGRHALAAGAGAAAAVAIAALVAFSRVYSGQHYPSDVVAGAVLGLAWLALARELVLRVSRQQQQQQQPRGPG